jgi:hypothetical protein
MTRTVPRMPPMYINFSDGKSQPALEHERVGLSGRYRTQYGVNSTYSAILEWAARNSGTLMSEKHPCTSASVHCRTHRGLVLCRGQRRCEGSRHLVPSEPAKQLLGGPAAESPCGV